jgi:hypothetical protein
LYQTSLGTLHSTAPVDLFHLLHSHLAVTAWYCSGGGDRVAGAEGFAAALEAGLLDCCGALQEFQGTLRTALADTASVTLAVALTNDSWRCIDHLEALVDSFERFRRQGAVDAEVRFAAPLAPPAPPAPPAPSAAAPASRRAASCGSDAAPAAAPPPVSAAVRRAVRRAEAGFAAGVPAGVQRLVRLGLADHISLDVGGLFAAADDEMAVAVHTAVGVVSASQQLLAVGARGEAREAGGPPGAGQCDSDASRFRRGRARRGVVISDARTHALGLQQEGVTARSEAEAAGDDRSRSRQPAGIGRTDVRSSRCVRVQCSGQVQRVVRAVAGGQGARSVAWADPARVCNGGSGLHA